MHAKFFSAQISKEILLRHSHDPFNRSPFPFFVSSALSVSPKQNDDFRVVMVLSRPTGVLFECFIFTVNFAVKLCGTDDAVRVLVSAGKDALMAELGI